MTASSPPPADDKVREVLWAAVDAEGPERLSGAECMALIDALLPAVSALLTEARADELEQAAKAWRWSAWSDTPRHADRAQDRIAAANYVGDWLAGRATHLRAAVRQTDERNDR